LVTESALRLGASVYLYRGPMAWSAEWHEDVYGVSTTGRGAPIDVNGSRVAWLDRLPANVDAVAALIVAAEDAHSDVEDALPDLPDMTFTWSRRGIIEVRPRGSDKAVGLSVAVARLGMDRSRVLAVGDSDNDVEMLRWAGTGVCVAGATPAAEAASDYVTSLGAAHGVVEVVRLVRNARRLLRPLAMIGDDEFQSEDNLGG